MTVTEIRTGPATAGPGAPSPGPPSPADPSPAAPSGMLPLSLFGVPLGLAGLGAGWSAARATLGAPAWPEEVLYGAASATWLILTTIYLLRGLRRKGAFRADRRHQIAGPFASFIPLVGILLSAHYSEYLPALGMWVCVAFIAALTVVATQLFAHWITGGVSMQAIHPGYFLPVVAGSFVASIGFSSIHAHDAALAAFGIGAFFWLVVGTVVTVRLMTAGALPPAAKTGLSAYLAAPATASVAWMVSHPGPMGALQLGLTGVLIIMLLMQLFLIGEYRKLPFSPLFWVFTFPVATTANYAVRWFAAANLPGRETYAWIALALATAFIMAIALRSGVAAIAGIAEKRRNNTPGLV
ncbi:tellurite resistance protein [Arthrobacter sp. ov407]|uniref:SLAC1 family transporter n=1 Tax=Arthrobacter sp. ov407 TaxID=1761748 RepID=UPI00088467D4|nr:TDT family transporter [Arthrobacter sp. ov407]SDK76900.1 tellurite resistance protein [Arthrobacter sp. ov407]